MVRKNDENNVVQSRKRKPSFYATSSQLIQPAADGEVKRLEKEFDDYKKQNLESIKSIEDKVDKLKTTFDESWSTLKSWLWGISIMVIILILILVAINPSARSLLSHISR